ncbi:MAG: hypothetical protein IKE74_06975 [Mogibacterium sp.]|nr:hypothetical protein [Mogibacterium sp.]
MVITAVMFLGFALCVAASVGVSRRLVVSSECEAFGRVWTKAVLSEYDVHLLEDYSIMAYFGNDSDVTAKLNAYLDYSAAGKLDAAITGANADLTGYELGDPANFRKALRLGFASNAASELLNGMGRTFRDLDSMDGYEEEGRVINDRVVLDTLPSGGAGGSVSADTLTENAQSMGDENTVRNRIAGAGAEILLIVNSFNNHVTASDDKEHFFVNEWEYIIRGSPDDEVNYRACRRRLFLARNALNLLSLYRDPAKVEIVIAVAEAITPGPLGIITQVIVAEAWAALETEADLDELYSDGRVPVLKTPEQWKTGLGAVLDSDDVRRKLDDESRENLDEKRGELDGIAGIPVNAVQIREGLNYDEYMMVMILAMNENTRLLRIMDLVQINMKYRYYKDFNMMEYYIGTRFTIDANGRTHVFEDQYK